MRGAGFSAKSHQSTLASEFADCRYIQSRARSVVFPSGQSPLLDLDKVYTLRQLMTHWLRAQETSLIGTSMIASFFIDYLPQKLAE